MRSADCRGGCGGCLCKHQCQLFLKAALWGVAAMLAVDFILNFAEYTGIVYVPISASREGQEYLSMIRGRVQSRLGTSVHVEDRRQYQYQYQYHSNANANANVNENARSKAAPIFPLADTASMAAAGAGVNPADLDIDLGLDLDLRRPGRLKPTAYLPLQLSRPQHGTAWSSREGSEEAAVSREDSELYSSTPRRPQSKAAQQENSRRPLTAPAAIKSAAQLMRALDWSFPRYSANASAVPTWILTPLEQGQGQGRAVGGGGRGGEGVIGKGKGKGKGNDRFPVTDARWSHTHRFFDSSPISPSGRYVALLRMPDVFTKRPHYHYHGASTGAGLGFDPKGSSAAAAYVVLLDLFTGRSKVVGATTAWGAQLGAHVQWGASDRELLFNIATRAVGDLGGGHNGRQNTTTTAAGEPADADRNGKQRFLQSKVTGVVIDPLQSASYPRVPASRRLNGAPGTVTSAIASTSNSNSNSGIEKGTSQAGQGARNPFLRLARVRPLSCPVYHVSADGLRTVAPDLSKIRHTQMGYGADYVDGADGGVSQDSYAHYGPHVGAPDDDGVFVGDVQTGNCELVISLKTLANLAGIDAERTPVYGFHTKWSHDGRHLLIVIRSLELATDIWSRISSLLLLLLLPPLRVRRQHLFVSRADGSQPRFLLSWSSRPFRSPGLFSAVRHDEFDGNHPNWAAGASKITMNTRKKNMEKEKEEKEEGSEDAAEAPRVWEVVMWDVDALFLPAATAATATATATAATASLHYPTAAAAASSSSSSSSAAPAVLFRKGTGHPTLLAGAGGAGRYLLLDAYSKEGSLFDASALRAAFPASTAVLRRSVPLRLVDTHSGRERWLLRMQLVADAADTGRDSDSDIGGDNKDTHGLAIEEALGSSSRSGSRSSSKARPREHGLPPPPYELSNAKQHESGSSKHLRAWRCDMHPAVGGIDNAWVVVNGRAEGGSRQVLISYLGADLGRWFRNDSSGDGHGHGK